jgi:hypothetical protein
MGISVFPAAGGGPTLTEISGVTPFPTWTTVANGTNWNGTTTLTVSGLSSYKTLRISYYFDNNNTSDCNLRFNGDTANNYNYVSYIASSGTYINGDIVKDSRINLGYNSGSGQVLGGFLEIDNNGSTTGPKLISGWMKRGADSRLTDFKGMYTSNSVISSFTFTATTNVTNSQIYILGR